MESTFRFLASAFQLISRSDTTVDSHAVCCFACTCCSRLPALDAFDVRASADGGHSFVFVAAIPLVDSVYRIIQTPADDVQAKPTIP